MLKAKPASVSQIVLFAAIIAALQIFALSHSAAHGDIDHSHDGVPCVFQTSSDSGQDVPARLGPRANGTVLPVRFLRQNTQQVIPESGVADGIRDPPIIRI
ncbi:MAG: hypothetical protein CMM52_10510 [Rhodospirillaceae bacterium]|nr:hypothetical protein [Rhodospirillaceae bacterium]|tara:strand:+ start:23730 stop:24032 length:303 start_codon:yes stop_codon:yes gene_type:complete